MSHYQELRFKLAMTHEQVCHSYMHIRMQWDVTFETFLL